VIACANWAKLKVAKGVGDIKKMCNPGATPPDHLLLMAGGSVAASVRTKTIAAAKAAGIGSIEIWSGPEFEEQLRLHAEPVLRRFIDGEELPDDVDQARALDAVPAERESATLTLMRGVFERPAFETPFAGESNLGDFRRALGDVIGAVNTGIVRDRHGAIIQRIPNRAAYESATTRRALAEIVHAVDDLRTAFETHVRGGTIRACGCNDPNCAVFMIDQSAAVDLDDRRRMILDSVSMLVGAPVGRAR
jgi:hypothetical protein